MSSWDLDHTVRGFVMIDTIKKNVCSKDIGEVKHPTDAPWHGQGDDRVRNIQTIEFVTLI